MHITKTLNSILGYYQKGKLEQARDLCRKILKKQPAHIDALHFLGVISFELGDTENAFHSLQKVVKLDPYFADAYNNLGNIFRQKNKYNQAEDYYQKAIQLDPRLAQAYYNLGFIFQEQNKFDKAIEHYRSALQLNFVTPGLYNNLGLALQEKGLFQEAAECYRQALHLNPDFTDAYYNLGNIFRERGDLQEAVEFYQKAIQLNPKFIQAYNNLGNAYQDYGRHDEAINCYDKALELNPHFTEAYYNMGNAFTGKHNLKEAVVFYDKAIALDPHCVRAHWAKCMSQLPVFYLDSDQINDVRNKYRNELISLRNMIYQNKHEDIRSMAEAVGSGHPFLLACQGLNNRDLQKIYGDLVCRIMSLRYPEFKALSDFPACRTGEPLRIGVVSRFFYWHSVWKIPMRGWIENISKERFHIYGYYTGRAKDKVTEAARKHCYRFVEDIYSLEELCRIIKKDDLHAIIYPDIGMDPVALKLAALRFAPVQCVSLGHPDTTGLPTIDYYLSSDLMEPADADDHYTERLIRLPNVGFHYSPLAVSSVEANRETFGLNSKAIIYLCTHALFTHLPQYDFLYPQIAANVPDCRFVFISDFRPFVTRHFLQRIGRAFSKYNMNAEDYVIMLPRLSQAEYHGLNRVADIFLDTMGWSANNSTFEALACNLPVVTLPGDLMRQRHCAGILKMMGMKETIVSSLDEYVDLAVRLGKDSVYRQRISSEIANSKYKIYNDMDCIHALENFLEKHIAKKCTASLEVDRRTK